MKSAETIVIGSGPAGLSAAISCKQKPVLVLEKNTSAGKKLLIAGSGRCNLTHDSDIKDFFDHYGLNARFLKTALLNYSNRQLIDFFKEKGLDIYIDKNGKVFPESDSSANVLSVLLKCCKENEVEVVYKQNVISVKHKNGQFAVRTPTESYLCKNIIVATGGKSYVNTGSTGDGYEIARSFGHTIVTPKPALTPVYSNSLNLVQLAGVTLQNLLICLYRKNKKIAEHKGDVVFTHKGLSGPGILDFSRQFEAGDLLKLNFTGLHSDDFRHYFIAAVEMDGKSTVQSFLKRFDIPKSLIQTVLGKYKIDPTDNLAEITKAERITITNDFCEFEVAVTRMGGFDVAMVTAGGVHLSEVSSRTMESKLVSGLYFAGEVLDIDGDTGGYNLQAAFSTGHLAGKSISNRGLGV